MKRKVRMKEQNNINLNIKYNLKYMIIASKALQRKIYYNTETQTKILIFKQWNINDI